ncbi:cutinase-domain-containing protein [Aspergillus eucalypticola CBS 122712]|uniref:Cutinase n=1 Tax=Aspergillus eucalypticola (strain CBS 122712 / IBT 29274) TaxID=1448314 RepID=A0A317UNN0_ASPEC|nr:cutinase-domain-containing protein [Aspergillus eucalypticola CBS 122712]PWY61670.1 cutinase-domain-containing protein [Aspergillus eucalypticola CBS 122712]
MKSVVALSLLTTALGAPTQSVNHRSLLGRSSTGTSDGLGALESLFPISGASTGTSTSDGLGALESLFPSSGTSTSDGLGALESLFPSSGTTTTSGSSGDFSSLFGRATTDSSTANDVTDNTGCKELTFIFARGTSETGNMGTIVGPEVASDLKSLTSNKVAVQGVDYPADWAGNADMGASGGSTMASLVKQAISQCPNTTVVVGGYSQGAMVVHNAASQLSSGEIQAAVLFGDPLKAESVDTLDSSKVKEFCATGDPVCENGSDVMAHLSYGDDAQTAAQFLVSAVGL